MDINVDPVSTPLDSGFPMDIVKGGTAVVTPKTDLGGLHLLNVFEDGYLPTAGERQRTLLTPATRKTPPSGNSSQPKALNADSSPSSSGHRSSPAQLSNYATKELGMVDSANQVHSPFLRVATTAPRLLWALLHYVCSSLGRRYAKRKRIGGGANSSNWRGSSEPLNPSSGRGGRGGRGNFARRGRGFTGRDRDSAGRDRDRETDRRPPPLRRPGRQSLDEVAEATLLLLLVPDAELEPTPRLQDVGDERLHLEFDEVQEATLRLGEVDEVIPQFEEVQGMI
ncbi:hypothetical protein BKA70DRAFT_1234160 [Coprinopsis sp. MPI-PUGE-AT-0042]|nr:hypothetical protein BKA70DRAFT_1234160 [Coprinopsis sp. MPI-PUGE-AT-0042]